MDEDIKKGKLKEMKRDETFGFDLTVSGGGKKKKKGKKPKKSQRMQDAENVLALDVIILEKLGNAGLTPPATIEDIPKLLEQIKTKKAELEKGNVPVEEPKVEPKKEEKPKVEPKRGKCFKK